MKAVRISLELAIVPIRKFLIIFYIYLRLLFGNEPHEQIIDEKEKHRLSSERIQKNKHLLYLLEYADIFVASDLTPRFNIKTKNPVELFYKRHMSTDQPIPQVIVVGILRVLLTTCPNNQRNAGGIDLHAEWSSCLHFLIHYRAFFKEIGFKSKAFSKSDELLNYIPKKERERLAKQAAN